MSNGQGDIGLCQESLLETLNNLFSSDESTKQEAEKKIQELETQMTDQFGISLIECAVDTNSSNAVRELASSTLKQYVEAHWYSSSETFQSPEIGSESKTKILELLFVGFHNTTNVKILNTMADSISIIAQSDFPDTRPELFDTLLNHLNSRSNCAIYGSQLVLFRFAQQLTDSQLLNFAPDILREMYKIFENEKHIELIRRQAINIFRKMITSIAAYEQPELIQQCLEPSIPKFCAEFLETLGVQIDFRTDILFRTKMVKTIEVLLQTLPKCVSSFLPKMLPLIWDILNDCARVYRQTTVDLRKGSHACDGLVLAIMDLINALMMGSAETCPMSRLPEYDLPDYHWFYLQDSLPPEVFRHLIIFIEIPDKKIELWTDNLVQFIMEEKLTDDSVCPRSIRREAQKLLVKIVDRPERAPANALCDVLLKQINEGYILRGSRDSEVDQNWWKLHEASIQVFGIIRDIIVEKQRTETLSFDVAAFLKNVVLQDLENSEFHPLLLGSCLYVGGLYAEQMPLELRSRFLEFTINGLKNQPACTRICAAKATALWLNAASAEGNNSENERIVTAKLPALFQGLFNLGNQLMFVEVLKIVLENFATLTTFDTAFTASVESSICTLTISAFFNFRSNSSISKICQEIFSKLAMNPECVNSLHSRLVPMIVAKLAVDPSEKPKDEMQDLDVLQILVQHSPQPLNSFLMDSAFPAACRFILSSEDCPILLRGAKVICTYLSVAAQLVIGYKDNDGKTGPQYISKVAAHLLNSKFTEFLIDDICEIMTTLITAGNTLKENLNCLLESMLTEMMKRTETRPCVRKLLMVYARLLNIEFDAVLEFLSTAQGPNEQSALAFVLSDGFCKEHDSFDRDDRRIVTLALLTILEYGMTHSDSSLHQIYFRETAKKMEANAEGCVKKGPESVMEAIPQLKVQSPGPDGVEDNAEHDAEGNASREISLLVKISRLIASQL